MKKTLKILAVVMIIATLMLPLALATIDMPTVSISGDAVKAVETDINNVTSDISSIIYTVGIAIALVVIVVFGVQWIVATPAKKAELKGKAWNIVIGVAILVGATFILGTVGTFFEQMLK